VLQDDSICQNFKCSTDTFAKHCPLLRVFKAVFAKGTDRLSAQVLMNRRCAIRIDFQVLRTFSKTTPALPFSSPEDNGDL
jgi:hypothetical protein